MADSEQLAPLGYAEIVTAVLFGYFAYRHLPDALTWVGIGVITAAGLRVSLWQRRAVARAVRRTAR